MPKHTASLREVVDKLKRIAELEFENKLCDNILTIFNRLHVWEKKVLLRGMINICFIIDSKKSTGKDNPEPEALEAGVTTIEDYNKIELIKLKTWLVKATATIAALIVVCFIFILLNVSYETTNPTTEIFFKVFEVILTS